MNFHGKSIIHVDYVKLVCTEIFRTGKESKDREINHHLLIGSGKCIYLEEITKKDECNYVGNENPYLYS